MSVGAKRALRSIGAVVATGASALLLFVVTSGEASRWSMGYFVAFLLAALGCWMRTRMGNAAIAGGTCFLVLTVIARLHTLDAVRPPGVRPADQRFVNALYPEADGAMAAARLTGLLGMQMHHGGDPPLAEVMRGSYALMTRDIGDVATPAIATYLGMQSPDAFDTVRFDPPSKGGAAVVFLHGFSGNFVVYCWQLAQTVTPLGLTTVCPSTGPAGDWWMPGGHEIVRTTLETLRAEGFSRIYLAGLSNGAIGAGILAPAFDADLSGLILLSGAPPSGNARRTALPTLAVTGDGDANFSLGYVREYVDAAPNGNAKLVTVTGGHFVFLARPGEVGRAIREWLKAQPPN